MRRPNALRRLRGGAIDRRIAAGAFSVAAVALAVTAGVAHEPLLAAGPRPDPAAARALIGLMRAGEHEHWSVTYDFTRTLATGRVLRQVMQEARNDTWHVLSAGTTMTIDHGDRTYECNRADTRPSCIASSDGPVLPASEVMRVAVANGAYGVTRLPPSTIAGWHARCFRAFATENGLPDLGTEQDLCLALDGVPLSQRLVRSSGDVDERVARSVSRRVTTATIEALVRSFDPAGVTARR